jgi:hypothetical protein
MLALAGSTGSTHWQLAVVALTHGPLLLAWRARAVRCCVRSSLLLLCSWVLRCSLACCKACKALLLRGAGSMVVYVYV